MAEISGPLTWPMLAGVGPTSFLCMATRTLWRWVTTFLGLAGTQPATELFSYFSMALYFKGKIRIVTRSVLIEVKKIIL